MKAPKEDPADRAARLRERRLSEIDQTRAGQKTAGDLTSDLRSVYGFRGIPLMFGGGGASSSGGAPRQAGVTR